MDNEPINEQNDTETYQSVQNGTTTNNIPEIVQLLAKKPELRRELVIWIKREFGFNAESVLENYFGELPDKKIKIEDHERSMIEIAEEALNLFDDGYSSGQIAKILQVNVPVISKISTNRRKWKNEIRDRYLKQIKSGLPWYLKPFARFYL